MPAATFSTDPEVRRRLRAIRCALARAGYPYDCEPDAWEDYHDDIAYLLEHSTLAELWRFWDKAADAALQDYVSDHFHLCWSRRCGICRPQV
jgi:hypothetical protein